MTPSQNQNNDENFQLDSYVKAIDDKSIDKIVGDLLSTSLDKTKPLWKLYTVQGDNEWHVIYRVHHSISDGLATMRLVWEMINNSNQGIEFEKETIYDSVTISTEQIAKYAAMTMKAESRPAVLKFLVQVFFIPYYFCKQILGIPDTCSILRKPSNGEKSVCWKYIDTVENVKAVGKKYNGNLNIVMFSCMAKAFDSLIQRHGPREKYLKFYVAANLRKYEEKPDDS